MLNRVTIFRLLFELKTKAAFLYDWCFMSLGVSALSGGEQTSVITPDAWFKRIIILIGCGDKYRTAGFKSRNIKCMFVSFSVFGVFFLLFFYMEAIPRGTERQDFYLELSRKDVAGSCLEKALQYSVVPGSWISNGLAQKTTIPHKRTVYALPWFCPAFTGCKLLFFFFLFFSIPCRFRVCVLVFFCFGFVWFHLPFSVLVRE